MTEHPKQYITPQSRRQQEFMRMAGIVTGILMRSDDPGIAESPTLGTTIRDLCETLIDAGYRSTP